MKKMFIMIFVCIAMCGCSLLRTHEENVFFQAKVIAREEGMTKAQNYLNSMHKRGYITLGDVNTMNMVLIHDRDKIGGWRKK